MSQSIIKPQARPGDPCVMVIFGGAGDLTKRNLLLALCNLAHNHLLPKEFAVVGVAREAISTDDFRQRLTRDIQEFATCPVEPAMWDWLVKRLYYVPGDFRSPEAYRQLQELLAKVDTECGTPGSYLYYLATPPSFFAEIIRQLGAAGLVHEGNGRWRRLRLDHRAQFFPTQEVRCALVARCYHGDLRWGDGIVAL
jgi:glucose-6-phosphate 1-dehydrogenase